MSRTFKPNMDEINKIPQPFLSKWIEALKVSKQHKGLLVSDDGDAHCWLGVACKVAGFSNKEMSNSVGESYSYPLTKHYRRIGIRLVDLDLASIAETGINCCPVLLNDEHLTHPQMAELLSGNEVTIEDAE